MSEQPPVTTPPRPAPTSRRLDPAAFPGESVPGWFRLIRQRRIDRKSTVLRDPVWAVSLVALAASAAAFALLFLDPVYLGALREGGFGAQALFEIVTELGESEWILWASGLLMLALSILPRNGLLLSRREPRFLRQQAIQSIYYVFTTVALAGIVTNLVKNLVGRARPRFVEPGQVWQNFPFRDHYDFASFPSGHATNAGAFFMSLALLFPRYRILFLLVGGWIAISRPVIGVHFPSDVTAGFLWGCGFAYFWARGFARKRMLFAFGPDGQLWLRRRFLAGQRAPKQAAS